MPGGSGTGIAQDATIQAILAVFGVATPMGGSGTGIAQDASLQQLLTVLSVAGFGAFVDVAHTAAPTNNPNWKFACDSSGGPVAINLTGALAANQILQVSSVAGANQLIFKASTLAGAPTIWDPSTGAFAAQAVLTNGAGGDKATWQFEAANNRFIQTA